MCCSPCGCGLMWLFNDADSPLCHSCRAIPVAHPLAFVDCGEIPLKGTCGEPYAIFQVVSTVGRTADPSLIIDPGPNNPAVVIEAVPVTILACRVASPGDKARIRSPPESRVIIGESASSVGVEESVACPIDRNLARHVIYYNGAPLNECWFGIIAAIISGSVSGGSGRIGISRASAEEDCCGRSCKTSNNSKLHSGN